MEYKQSKYIWNQQLAGFSASDLSFNRAVHIYKQLPMTANTLWSEWHFTMQLISAWHGPNAPQYKPSEGEAV